MSTDPQHRRRRPSDSYTETPATDTGTETAEILELTPKPSRADLAKNALRRGPEIGRAHV